MKVKATVKKDIYGLTKGQKVVIVAYSAWQSKHATMDSCLLVYSEDGEMHEVEPAHLIVSVKTRKGGLQCLS